MEKEHYGLAGLLAKLMEGLLEGTSFGKYQLIELLGRGGMGEVWRAYDSATERVVALKILPAEISNDAIFQQRFRREAHSTARLNNPHLIPIHTYGEINGRLFVDMRLIEGRDLQAELNTGPMAPARAVGIINQVAKALNAAHRDGLLHRDVKPSNILLDPDDFAYLIDFGIARAAGDLALTKAGDFVGTWHYMAPERFSTSTVDARSDVYSLSCVLYECLTAQHPFPGTTLQQQVTSHLTAPPPRPTSTNPGLPGALDVVIAKGMAKHPDDRYDTAVELAKAANDALVAPPQAEPTLMRPAVPIHDHFGARPDPRPPRFPPPQPPPPPPPRMPPPRTPPPQQDPGPRTPLPQHDPGPPTMARPAQTPPPTPAPVAARPATTPPQPSKPWWRRKAVAAAVLVTVAAILTGVVAFGSSGPATEEFHQITLPFRGLSEPQGLSVDAAGTVYVADSPHNRILALFAGADAPHPLPFEGLNYPTGVTADPGGSVYVNDARNRRVLVLRAGSQKQEELHFTDLQDPTGLSVDGSRTVYVTDTARNRVVMLRDGSIVQEEVPFSGLNSPTGLVVSSGGTVYVADGGNNRVLMLAPGKDQQEVGFENLKKPGGVTLDGQGAVYVNDAGHNRTLKLPPGSSEQVELRFTGLDNPWGLAVDRNGTVYVGGHNSQIVALKPK